MVPRGLKYEFEFLCSKSRLWNPKYENLKYENGVMSLGNCASQDFDAQISGSFAENCGDLWRLSFYHAKWPTTIAEICADDESAQNFAHKCSNSGS